MKRIIIICLSQLFASIAAAQLPGVKHLSATSFAEFPADLTGNTSNNKVIYHYDSGTVMRHNNQRNLHSKATPIMYTLSAGASTTDQYPAVEFVSYDAIAQIDKSTPMLYWVRPKDSTAFQRNPQPAFIAFTFPQIESIRLGQTTADKSTPYIYLYMVNPGSKQAGVDQLQIMYTSPRPITVQSLTTIDKSSPLIAKALRSIDKATPKLAQVTDKKNEGDSNALRSNTAEDYNYVRSNREKGKFVPGLDENNGNGNSPDSHQNRSNTAEDYNYVRSNREKGKFVPGIGQNVNNSTRPVASVYVGGLYLTDGRDNDCDGIEDLNAIGGGDCDDDDATIWPPKFGIEAGLYLPFTGNKKFNIGLSISASYNAGKRSANNYSPNPFPLKDQTVTVINNSAGAIKQTRFSFLAGPQLNIMLGKKVYYFTRNRIWISENHPG